jgi:hypothetical protein
MDMMTKPLRIALDAIESGAGCLLELKIQEPSKPWAESASRSRQECAASERPAGLSKKTDTDARASQVHHLVPGLRSHPAEGQRLELSQLRPSREAHKDIPGEPRVRFHRRRS